MSVWLSTTMIQALRDLIDLYTFFFETLERFLDGLLDLLFVCICQREFEGNISNNISAYLQCRERHIGPDWHILFATTFGEQC
jgi:Sec7-like guanine-nucleotide exchange factor